MKYRELGSTGLQISEIVFGAGAVGGVVFRPDRQTRLASVRRALEHGINWIDTAAGYGDGQSEENLGWIMKKLGASPHISTKVGIGPDHLDDIPGTIERSAEASLRRLQMDSIDLIQLHSAVALTRGTSRNALSIDDVLREDGVLTSFERLRQRGLVRFFGFTGFGGELEAYRQMITGGNFQTVQAYYNLLNPSAGRRVPDGFSDEDHENIIDLAAQNGMGVLNVRVLAGGAIAGQEPPPRVDPSRAAADMKKAARVRETLGDEAGSMAQTGIRYALMNPGVSGVEVGFSKLEHIDEAVAAVDMGPLSEGVMQKLEALYASGFGGE